MDAAVNDDHDHHGDDEEEGEDHDDGGVTLSDAFLKLVLDKQKKKEMIEEYVEIEVTRSTVLFHPYL